MPDLLENDKFSVSLLYPNYAVVIK